MILTFQMENGAVIRTQCQAGENVLTVARSAGVALDAPCSGNGSCGKCRVRLLEGTLSSAPSRHITPEEAAQGWHLGCCSTVSADATVLVPQKGRELRFADAAKTDLASGIRALREAGVTMENGFLTADVTMEQPALSDTMPDNERLMNAICDALGVDMADLSFHVLKKLPGALRSNGFSLRVLGRREGNAFHCMDIAPAGVGLCVGCAIDIGTTTVSALLLDLKDGTILSHASCGNAQMPYGADVISRIVEQGRPGGRERLRRAMVEETLTPLLQGLCARVGIEKENILRVCIGANTTMNHLLLGVDAEPVRMEPYIPAFFRLPQLRAGDLGLPMNPDAPVRMAPNIGSYVGGDITAGAFASLLWKGEELRLLIDLGTNGELVFGNEEFLMSCACSAGPAFEGGGLSCGMRASPGAIEGCRIHPKTLEPELRIIGDGQQRPAGICGSGVIDVIAELLRHGVINGQGDFQLEHSRVRRDEHGVGRYVLARPWESADGREVFIDEVDIDNFIRAKGAIFSAIDTMLSSLEMTEDMLSRVYVAGGIGSGIHMENAMYIGMLPRLPEERFRYIGNACLAGVYAAALGDGAWERLEQVASNMTYLELSTCPGYMDAFVAASFLPHTDRARFTPGGQP